ncbi:contractile injection system protein, VgrG/Pvc8 family [Halodesulfovibrio sp. MK-HDV]|jgi:Bacteriophage probable baseplate hub protein|uniref:contractile injection system protein, VgrG/Pvc8 family n=1 Tax=Halodesulfovibrio sp. MK-HDV TaxID=2599925 RepID=UPI001367A99F|nr:contractile injection system protein, VgrG/Pvc8 family [Halodesulfovibrio sp. MK-HDV]KAF1075914.1 hypothetical protein MKHDV_01712 [Halodesulfovibrio sp. MK-HDV]
MVVGYALDYQIKANGKDITKLLQEHSAQITITDAAGYESDKLSIQLNDPGIAMPATGAELTVHLGEKDRLWFMGKYIVDEVALNFPPDSMAISANSAPFDKSTSGFSPLQSQKKRSFSAGTINTLVCTIANEHGLEPLVSPRLAKAVLPHINQIDESDMHLLTRIAKEHDAISKANGGKLLFVERGKGKNPRGEDMPVLTLTKQQVTSGSAKLSLRGTFKKVVATYRDTGNSDEVEITAGNAEPVFRLKGMYSSKQAAFMAAHKRLDLYKRGTWTLSLSLPLNPDLVAESKVILKQFRTGINGEWIITKATHTMSNSGGVTSVEGELVLK